MTRLQPPVKSGRDPQAMPDLVLLVEGGIIATHRRTMADGNVHHVIAPRYRSLYSGSQQVTVAMRALGRRLPDVTATWQLDAEEEAP